MKRYDLLLYIRRVFIMDLCEDVCFSTNGEIHFLGNTSALTACCAPCLAVSLRRALFIVFESEMQRYDPLLYIRHVFSSWGFATKFSDDWEIRCLRNTSTLTACCSPCPAHRLRHALSDVFESEMKRYDSLLYIRRVFIFGLL